MKKKTVSLLTAAVLLLSLLLTGCGEAKKDAQAFRDALAAVQIAESDAELWSDEWSQTVASLRQSCEALSEDAKKALGADALSDAEAYLDEMESDIRASGVSHEISLLDPSSPDFAESFRKIAEGAFAALSADEQRRVNRKYSEYFDGMEKAEQAAALLDALADCPDAELEARIGEAEAACADASAARFLSGTDALDSARTRLAAVRLDTEIAALEEMTYEKLVADKLPAAHTDLVRQTRQDYDAAPGEVKALVKNADTLHRQEVMLEAAALEIAIDEVDDEGVSFVTEYEEARTLYEAASDEAKAMISNAALLTEADAAYEQLEVHVILEQFGDLISSSLVESGFADVDYAVDYTETYPTLMIVFSYPSMGLAYRLAVEEPSLLSQIDFWESSLNNMQQTYNELLQAMFTEQLGSVPEYDFALVNADDAVQDGGLLYLVSNNGAASALPR